MLSNKGQAECKDLMALIKLAYKTDAIDVLGLKNAHVNVIDAINNIDDTVIDSPIATKSLSQLVALLQRSGALVLSLFNDVEKDVQNSPHFRSIIDEVLLDMHQSIGPAALAAMARKHQFMITNFTKDRRFCNLERSTSRRKK